jgi:hypothetical protein
MVWPTRGVYFVLEKGELRSGSGTGSRVVRVGTHGLKVGATSTLWGRLAQHRGSVTAGNHRGSVFRQHVGRAIAARDPVTSVLSWGRGSSAPPEFAQRERDLESKVSAVISEMSVLWLAIDDEPGRESQRGFAERNAIALLSAYGSVPIDPPSSNWLGYHCPSDRVKGSGLWNSNHVDETVDPDFLSRFEDLIETGASRPVASTHFEPRTASLPEASRNRDLIIGTLQGFQDLDDDELSRCSGVVPRQQVNAICRELQKRGIVERLPGVGGKIITRLADAHLKELPSTEHRVQPPAREHATEFARGKLLCREVRVCLSSGADDTLFVIPCSGRKRKGSVLSDHQGTLLDDLPTVLARRLEAARIAVAGAAGLDESELLPAWQRYSGQLYEKTDLSVAKDHGAVWFQRLLILSAAYGVVRGVDPIGSYNQKMDQSDWPHGLLQEVITSYATKHQVRRVIGLASSTTGYAKILRRVGWREAGVNEALLLSPEASRGAMVLASRAMGEALRIIIDDCWEPSWQRL